MIFADSELTANQPAIAGGGVEVQATETVISSASTSQSTHPPADKSATALDSAEVVKHALDLLVTFLIAKVPSSAPACARCCCS